MGKQLLTAALFPLALGLVAAVPGGNAEDRVRAGNAAFARGEYGAALAFYRQAETRATDPGQVAYNEGAALFAQGDYEGAERHYWLCLGDAGPSLARLLRTLPNQDLPAPVKAAAGPRLTRALYNLGNCALRRSEGTNPDELTRAILFYEHCLWNDEAEAGLRRDARHNLELARVLLARCPKKKAKNHSQETEPKENNPGTKERSGTKPEETGEGPNQPRNKAQPTDQSPDPGADAQLTEEMTPGRGNLATLPDTDQLRPLSPQEAAVFLRRTVERIVGERRAYQEQATRSPGRNVLDW